MEKGRDEHVGWLACIGSNLCWPCAAASAPAHPPGVDPGVESVARHALPLLQRVCRAAGSTVRRGVRILWWSWWLCIPRSSPQPLLLTCRIVLAGGRGLEVVAVVSLQAPALFTHVGDGRLKVRSCTLHGMQACPLLLPQTHLTIAAAISAVRKGSSPGVSLPRPQRGSRKILMLGPKQLVDLREGAGCRGEAGSLCLQGCCAETTLQNAGRAAYIPKRAQQRTARALGCRRRPLPRCLPLAAPRRLQNKRAARGLGQRWRPGRSSGETGCPLMRRWSPCRAGTRS